MAAWVAPAIMAAGSVLSSWLGSKSGGGERKQAISDLEGARERELSYWDRLLSSDPLYNSENQAALRQARELLKANNQRTAATAAVTGATDESVALQKAAANESLEDITADIAAGSTQFKTNAMQNYLNANKKYTDAINDARLKRGEDKANATNSLISGLTNAAVSYFGGSK